ncbi:monocarboxylate transporter 2-like [Catharus ustulatus]|uniref:monocarboxylate transporter 2-like n=1 Tax=Catharus ustulatus TaxID=91951 RepID=UPI00140E80A8|nr:monocarboxylate transporter 2-like [Catharus ustulatus]
MITEILFFPIWILSTAPVASSLCAQYTHRTVVITGGLLAFSGMALGFFGFNMVWMYATTGFLQGLGISFSWTPAISIVSHYFSKKRALANAVASAGECAFAFMFGPFFQWLISQYGWKGALLIIGGIQLNVCVCGVLMRPLASSCLLKARHCETETPPGNSASRRDKDKSPITHKTFNWMLVRRPEFVLYAIFGILAAMSFFVPPLFLVPLSYSLGIDESWTSTLLSILAIVDFGGRLLCGWYANLHVTKTIHLLAMTITLMSTSLMLLPLANNYVSLAIFTGFYGFFFGTTVSIHITVLADVVGMPEFDSALGLFMLIRSTGGFVGPPLAGKLRQLTAKYSLQEERGMVIQAEKIWICTQISPFLAQEYLSQEVHKNSLNSLQNTLLPLFCVISEIPFQQETRDERQGSHGGPAS